MKLNVTKSKWIAGAVIVVLLGLNLFQGALLLGQKARQDARFEMTLGLRNLRELSPDDRQMARQVMRERSPGLRSQLKAARLMRRDIANYIASPEYERQEAERRLTELRKITLANQYTAQMVMLDIADRLPAEERQKMVRRNR